MTQTISTVLLSPGPSLWTAASQKKNGDRLTAAETPALPFSVQGASLEEGLGRLREVELPRLVSDLRLTQERGVIEAHKEVTRVRHEVRPTYVSGLETAAARRQNRQGGHSPRM